MTTRARLIVPLLLAVPAVGFLWLTATGAGGQTPDPHAAALSPLGQAYAATYGLTWTKVDTVVSGTVGADAAAWAQRLTEALAVGYTPGAGGFQAVPLTPLKDLAKVEMASARTPVQEVQAVLQPGTVVVQTTWHFGAAAPVQSYTVFAADGEPLFDTLLSLPVIPGPMLTPGHF